MSTSFRVNTGLSHNFNTHDKVQKVESHVRVRSRLFVNSEDRVANTGYDNAQYTSGSSIMKAQVQKIGLESFKFDISYPNVNSRNKEIIFFSNISGTNHTVLLDEAFYIVPDLITEIISKLNSVTGASGLTFSAVVAPGSLSNYILTCVGGSYRFLPSSHINRGKPLSGLFSTPTLVTPAESVSIVCLGFYTSYIDIVCNPLRDGHHIPDLFTSDQKFSNGGHIYRVHVTEYDELGINKLQVSKEVILPEIEFSQFRSKQLENMTIQLYDEFQQLIYSPDETVGGVTRNIDYLTYHLVFSLE